jgi:hypothetical protein
MSSGRESNSFKSAARFIDILIILAPILFLFTEAVFHVLPTGVSPFRQTVSTYRWSDYGVLCTIAFFLIGAVMVVFAARLFFTLKRDKYSKFGIWGISLAGLLMIVTAIFPSQQPGTEVTLQVRIHVGAADSVSAIFPIAIALLIPALRAGGFRTLSGYTLITFLVSATVDLAALLIIIFDLKLLGLMERLLILNSLIWIEVMAIKLLLPAVAFVKRAPEINDSMDL